MLELLGSVADSPVIAQQQFVVNVSSEARREKDLPAWRDTRIATGPPWLRLWSRSSGATVNRQWQKERTMLDQHITIENAAEPCMRRGKSRKQYRKRKSGRDAVAEQCRYRVLNIEFALRLAGTTEQRASHGWVLSCCIDVTGWSLHPCGADNVQAFAGEQRIAGPPTAQSPAANLSPKSWQFFKSSNLHFIFPADCTLVNSIAGIMSGPTSWRDALTATERYENIQRL